MRSPENTHRHVATVLILAAVLFAALGAWALVERSTIAWHLDGKVTNVEVREEKHPGIDDAWFVTVDGKARHWDSALADTIDEGDRIAKGRWDRTLLVNGDETRLRISDDARAMLVLFPVISATALALAWPRRRSRPVMPRRRPADHGARL